MEDEQRCICRKGSADFVQEPTRRCTVLANVPFPIFQHGAVTVVGDCFGFSCGLGGAHGKEKGLRK